MGSVPAARLRRGPNQSAPAHQRGTGHANAALLPVPSRSWNDEGTSQRANESRNSCAFRFGRNNRGDRRGQPVPPFRFFFQTLPAFAGELVKFGAPIIVRLVPLRFEKSLAHQAKQRWIKRALFN